MSYALRAMAVLAVAIVTAVGGRAVAQKAADALAIKAEDIVEITLKRAGGVLAPNYTVVLRKDAASSYEGVQGVSPTGQHTGRVDKMDFAKLAHFLLADGLLDMANEYGRDERAIDPASTTIIVRTANASKQVAEFGPTPPPELWRCQTLIDGVGSRIHWKETPK